jgi:phage terminase small subunit
MNPGSPLKLASQKLREGNTGGHKSTEQLKAEADSEVSAELLGECPKPPKHFNKVPFKKSAKDEWKYVCEALIERGVLTSGMLSVIARMCYVNAYIEQQETMGAQPNAALLGQHRLLYESFGLTPRSIGSTKALNGKKKESKLTKYLKHA